MPAFENRVLLSLERHRVGITRKAHTSGKTCDELDVLIRLIVINLSIFEKEFRDTAGNDTDEITDKIFDGKSCSDDDPEQSVLNPEFIAKAPELQKLHRECKYEDARRQKEGCLRLFGTCRSKQSVYQEHYENITDIISDKAVSIQTYQKLRNKKKK